ncbi:MAG TPA: RDD family protein [Luteimonas sp.]|nr:RDD family protein [Luteimonas sp.]
MAKWYYSDYERNRHGPVDDRDMAQLHADDQIGPETLVWREGLAQWQPWRTLAGEVVSNAPPPPVRATFAAPADPGLREGVNPYAMATPAGPGLREGVNPYAVAEPASPYAPPRAPVHRVHRAHAGGHVVYAGFWKRVAASLIDSFILALLGGVVGAAIGGLMGAVLGSGSRDAVQLLVQVGSAVLAACYYGWFYASVQQASPGKMAIGIKVVRGNGGGCGFWRGFGRYFAMIPSSLILGIGFLMAGFTARKQALHDLMCDTLVVDKWAYTDWPDQQREELGTVTWVVLVLGGLAVGALFLAVVAGIRLLAGAH